MNGLRAGQTGIERGGKHRAYGMTPLRGAVDLHLKRCGSRTRRKEGQRTLPPAPSREQEGEKNGRGKMGERPRTAKGKKRKSDDLEAPVPVVCRVLGGTEFGGAGLFGGRQRVSDL